MTLQMAIQMTIPDDNQRLKSQMTIHMKTPDDNQPRMNIPDDNPDDNPDEIPNDNLR
jgi:hypothetical protein